MSGWDTSNTNDMDYIFSDIDAPPTGLSDWDTSRVTSMKAAFHKIYLSYNSNNRALDISKWDVLVRDMEACSMA